MTAIVCSATNVGFEGKLIEVECDTSNGLPSVVIVGLGNKAIDEARERVRSAIKNSGLDFPAKRVTINLAPANLPKHGAQFDLPIAIALLAVSGQVPPEAVANTLFVGELALDGSLRPVAGVITHAEVARTTGKHELILPAANAAQAKLVDGITILPARSITDIVQHLRKIRPLNAQPDSTEQLCQTHPNLLADIRGQEQAKRALLVAAAGRHNLLLTGPPGAGKTMLARAITSILPPLTRAEMIDVTKVHSMAGENYETAVTERPFRTPHHSTSHIALTGGGSIPRPGEISLAHHGVLFLDELPEYSRQSLEALRQPLEDRRITIARAHDSVTFPANFMLVATQNPCPCGYAGDPQQECSCRPHQVQMYQKKISGPLLDRIDMVVEVSRVQHTTLLAPNTDSKGADDFREKLHIAAKKQQQRYTNSRTNATMTNKEVTAGAALSPTSKALLERAAAGLNLSARAYFKVIKVARTIADLEDAATIEPIHITEALQFRPRNQG